MFQRVRGVEKDLVNSVVGVKVIYGGPSVRAMVEGQAGSQGK
jgi:hypothetical protein